MVKFPLIPLLRREATGKYRDRSKIISHFPVSINSTSPKRSDAKQLEADRKRQESFH